MRQLIECVPNFSEGRDMTVIKQITDEIEKVEGVKLLDVDPGKATNRTVVTFVGHPDAVVEAAVILLFLGWALLGLRIARSAPDLYGRLVAVGLTALVAFAAFGHIAVALGLMPTEFRLGPVSRVRKPCTKSIVIPCRLPRSKVKGDSPRRCIRWPERPRRRPPRFHGSDGPHAKAPWRECSRDRGRRRRDSPQGR